MIMCDAPAEKLPLMAAQIICIAVMQVLMTILISAGVFKGLTKMNAEVTCRRNTKTPCRRHCKEFVKEAYARDLLLIPGYIFYPFKNGGRDHVRINYSFEKKENIEDGMKVFCDMIREITGI